MRIPRPFALLALTLTACSSSYDFTKARLPSGAWDFPKLIADLKASGKQQLSAGLWLPLIHLEWTTFRASDPTLPAGYTLQAANCNGPIFCVGDTGEWLVDENGATYERRERDWVLWGLPWFRDTESVETQRGTRVETDSRILLLIDNGSKAYVRAQPSGQP